MTRLRGNDTQVLSRLFAVASFMPDDGAETARIRTGRPLCIRRTMLEFEASGAADETHQPGAKLAVLKDLRLVIAFFEFNFTGFSLLQFQTDDIFAALRIDQDQAGVFPGRKRQESVGL